MPAEWNQEQVTCSYPLPQSPLISMSPFADSAYCYPTTGDYSHTYSSGPFAASNQLITSLSYPSYHPQAQINCHEVSAEEQEAPQERHHQPQPQPQSQLQPQASLQPCYSYVEPLVYSSHNLKVEAINSGSSEVTSTSTFTGEVSGLREQSVHHTKSGRKSKKKSQSECSKKSTSGRKKRKPDISYATIIATAIDKSPSQKLTLNEIYQFMAETWPEFFTGEYEGWKNSVRHNLSLNSCFRRVPKSETDVTESSRKSSNKGSYWIVLDCYKPFFHPSKGYQKRRPRNFQKLVHTQETLSHTMTTHHLATVSDHHYKQNEVVTDYYRKTLVISGERGNCVWNAVESHVASSDHHSITPATANDAYYDDLSYPLVN